MENNSDNIKEKLVRLEEFIQGSVSTSGEDKKTLLEQNIGLKSIKSVEIVDSEILVFQRAIQEMINSENNLQIELLQFIQKQHPWIVQLSLPNLIKLRNHFNHSLESVLFFIICLEFSKTFDVLVFREFTVFISSIFLNKNLQQVNIDDFHKLRMDYWPAYGQNLFGKYPNQREKVLKLHKEDVAEDLFTAHKKLLDILKVNFETSRELTLFAQILNLDKVENLDSKLSIKQKKEAKTSAQKLTFGGYDKVTKLVNYLKFAYATENDMMAFQTDENMQIFKDKVLFYLQVNHVQAFDFLEQMKSSVFLKQLAFQVQLESSSENALLKTLLQKEQKVQKEIKTVFLKKELGNFEEIAYLANKRNVLTAIYQSLKEVDFNFSTKYQAIRNGSALKFNELKKYL
ncbi:MAG: hypothetical protein ACPG49_00570 [Chitinophagales bacterium]